MRIFAQFCAGGEFTEATGVLSDEVQSYPADTRAGF